ncbi:hypothetical protein LCGC14_2395110 [marine sediment metagenome]|uniref:Uncharacterized protein n=1 Tax=marine sediment metagenome TaxID=412755 RepID=A0A0F9E9F7_9ZZZZ
MDASIKKSYERKIKHLFNDCACLWAGPVFIATLILLFNLTNSAHIKFWPEIILFFFIAVFAAMAAKLVGLRWSFYRLNKAIDELNDNELNKSNW